MLAGEAAYQAGTFRVEGQVVVPQGSVAGFGNALQAVAAPIVQGRAQFRLAGGNPQ